MKEKTEELTPEQKEIALQARRNYQRAHREAQRRTAARYWYNRALREAQAKEEAESNAEAVAETSR